MKHNKLLIFGLAFILVAVMGLADTYFNETFEDNDCSNWVSGCTVRNTAVINGSYSAEHTAQHFRSPTWTAHSDNFNITFWAKLPAPSGGSYQAISFTSNGGAWDTGVGLYFENGAGNCPASDDNFCDYAGGTYTDTGVQFCNNVVCKYTLEFNTTSGRYNIYINDTLRKANAVMRGGDAVNRNTLVQLEVNQFTAGNRWDDISVWNASASAPPFVQSNLTIHLTNLQNSSVINVGSAIIGGVNYTTTNGTIVTNVNMSGAYANINISSPSYITIENNSYNTSSSLTVQMYQAITILNATEYITGNQIFGGTFQALSYTGNSFYSNTGTIQANFTKNGYSPKASNLTVLYGTNYFNITDITNATLNITVIFFNTNAHVQNFSIYILNYNYSINFSINSSTTNGGIVVPLMSGLYYNVTIVPANYNLEYAIIWMQNYSKNYTYYTYTLNSFNITMLNERTDLQITDANFTLEFISSVSAYNYTVDGGKGYIDLLVPATYTLRYKSYQGTDYGRIREYYYILTNNSHTNLNLYALPRDGNSSEETVVVYDQTTLNTVEGAIVYLQRYYVEDNSYRTVAMYKTDVAGKSYFDIERNTEYYKFVIDYPFMTTVLTTSPAYIVATTLNLYINLLEETGETYFTNEKVSSLITFNTASASFTTTYNDAGVTGDSYCMYLKRYNLYTKDILNSSCSTASSGSISLTGLIANETNYAVFTIIRGGEETVLKTAWEDYLTSDMNAGKYGVFLTALIYMTFALMISMHLYALIIGASALVFAKLLGILSIGWSAVFGIVLFAIILASVIEMFKK